MSEALSASFHRSSSLTLEEDESDEGIRASW